mgnify:CR=1 FL=1
MVRQYKSKRTGKWIDVETKERGFTTHLKKLGYQFRTKPSKKRKKK